jgi:glycosyltransferase involved in cell wall biosynthesis/peptidoglycan/xylan/chitin deacetylase (PgdA/CDA1 family)
MTQLLSPPPVENSSEAIHNAGPPQPQCEASPRERRCRVAYLTNEIPPYRVPLYGELAATPGWEFSVFTCVDREVGRLWDVQQEFPFPTKRSYSLSYIRRIQHSGRETFGDVRQIHLPIGHLWDLWRFRPDVIISGELGARTLIAALYARLFRSRLLVYFEGTPHTERDISAKQRWVRRIIRRAPHAYLVDGLQGREYLEGIGVPGRSIFKIGQAIETDVFGQPQSTDERVAVRRSLGIDGFCFLFCGRLIELKGVDQLLDAWIRFSQAPDVQATLVLAGDGPARDRLERRVAEAGLTNVRFLGHVERSSLPAIYRAADVFVFPTLMDCWALAVNEALAAGLPVINSKYTGSTDLIEEDQTGWIVDPCDRTDLVDKLHRAWESRDDLPRMQNAARQAIAESSVPAIAERFRKCIHHVHSSRRSKFQRSRLRQLAAGPDRMKQGASLCAAALHRISGRRHGDRLGMLLHHRVSPIPKGLPEAPFNVRPEIFREQLEGLLDRGYRFVPFSEVLQAKRSGKPLAIGSVVLTFDDAYESVYRHAFPIMQELGVRGIAYLSTAFLDSEDPFPFDEYSLTHRDKLPPEEYRPLKTSQCREMLDSGLFEFGAHAHSHLDFRGRPEEFRQDVSQSISVLRQKFQLQDVAFAYPWGVTGTQGELVAAARQTGASCAVTTDGVLINAALDDHFTWGRFVVFPWDTPATLSAKLAGWYGWARTAKASISRVKRRAKGFVATSPLWTEVVSDLSFGAVECASVFARGHI